jgi:ADP-heptose:LPS heptosyltransferase
LHRRHGLAEQFFDARGCLRFLASMQDQRLDLALQMNGTGAYSNTFTLLLGARASAGYTADADWPACLDAALPYPDGVHEIHRVLALTTFIDAPARGDELDFLLWEEERDRARVLLHGLGRSLLGLHPAASDANKRWPPERFAELAAAVHRRCGLMPVLLGGPGERALAERVAAAIEGPCLNLAGRTSLPELGAVIASLAVLVSGDSGPAHIAYALDTPSVTIFGATSPAEWGPLGDAHRHRVLATQHDLECPDDNARLAAVSVADVTAAVEAALDG